MFLNHVFEHLAEPHVVLSHCRRLLNKSGKLFVAVPNLAGLRARLSFAFFARHFNVDERYRAFPIHLFYFTPSTLAKTLQKSGFGVAAVETFGFGMDEFITCPDSDSGGGITTPTSGTKKRSALRQALKKAFFAAGLGENLLAIAYPI